MKKQTGFTLIELIIVIIILGILAVTAAPKFLNLQGDARLSAAEGVAGAVSSAAQLTRGKRLINPNSNVGNVSSFGSSNYPANNGNGIASAVELSNDWAFSGSLFVNTDDTDCTVSYAVTTGIARVSNTNNCLN